MLALLVVGISAVTSASAFLISPRTKTMGRIDLLATPQTSAEGHVTSVDEPVGTISTERLLSSIIHAALRGSQTINSLCDQVSLAFPSGMMCPAPDETDGGPQHLARTRIKLLR